MKNSIESKIQNIHFDTEIIVCFILLFVSEGLDTFGFNFTFEKK